jgi:hypothetical protein
MADQSGPSRLPLSPALGVVRVAQGPFSVEPRDTLGEDSHFVHRFSVKNDDIVGRVIRYGNSLGRKKGNAMGKKLNAIVLLILSFLLSCTIGCADSGGLAIAGKAGTLGLGGELATAITSGVNARVGINALSFDYEGEAEDVEYDVGVDLLSFPAVIDLYPFNGPFRISGGALLNRNEIDLRARPTASEEIGGTVYTAAEIGTLHGDVEFDDIAPYLGIGWGNALDGDQKWGFLCDFGVAYIGSPHVSLSANGALASDPTFQQDLEREKDDIKDKWRRYRFYPVVSVGLFFRF